MLQPRAPKKTVPAAPSTTVLAEVVKGMDEGRAKAKAAVTDVVKEMAVRSKSIRNSSSASRLPSAARKSHSKLQWLLTF